MPKINNDDQSGIDNKIEDEIVKKDISNIEIRTMPKRFKISTDKSSGKTKIVGAIIMIAGAIVLIASVYLAYIYLINPQPKQKKQPTQPKQEEIVKETPVVEKKKEVKAPEIIKEEEIIEEVVEEEEEIIEIEEIATTTEEEEIVQTIEVELKDSDSDGISDKEENIFGTDKMIKDTDSDGYDDISELENGYNPAGEGSLALNTNLKTYQNTQFKYSTTIPSKWLKQIITDGSSAIFAATDGTFIQIISQKNENNQTIEEWYQEQFPEQIIGETDIIKKDKWQGLYHKNKYIFYLQDIGEKYIFAISYVPEPENDMSYYNIFKMIINNFIITD